ncbi:MAG: polyketide cyclase [Pseudomonadales bacterium]|nr:polyketide cyclase [Pseudomonadales bacterium]
MTLEGYTPTPPVEGISCESDGETSTLHFERNLAHPPEAAWKAITNASSLQKWMPFSIDRDIDTEGPALLTMNDGSEPPTYNINVNKVVPGQLVEYTWGESVLTWEVEATESGSKVTLHHSVPNPEWVTPAAAGWHMCFDLAELMLNGMEWGELAPIVGGAAMEYGWEKLAEHYKSVLGDKYGMAAPDQYTEGEE